MQVSRSTIIAKLRLAAGLIALTALTTATWLVLAAVVPALVAGWTPSVLTSGSMQPSLSPGDVVLVAPSGDDPLPVGAVMTFDDPGRAGRVTHRVDAVRSNGTYTTKGDANALADSTPVPPERVIGRGRLMVPMVGLPVVWLASGMWGRLAVLVVALVALALVAWYGLRRGRGPRSECPATGPHRRRQVPGWSPRRLALRAATVATGVAMVSVSVSVAALPGGRSAAAFTKTTANGSNSFAATGFFPRYLKTDAPGDRVSTPLLPLNTTAPTVTSLPNYDTNRDSSPGLLIKKGGVVGTSDSAKSQNWYETALTVPITVSGATTLKFWSAMKGFNTTQKGAVSAGLYDCSAAWACTLFASGSLAPSSAWSGGSGTWVEKTLSFGTLNQTIATGRILLLQVVVPSASDADMLFAYDTTAYPSRLEIP